ncbi:sulfurtransferase TusA family protein [Streptomyces sp. LN785]|uniref:sulfurtransferase TusA family protein n=1 Tax=Streptomyces sp. LN785 TaxID=3112983 RepID=UPI003710B88F
MSARHPAAAVVVEAGGEPWFRVEPLLDRRTREMADHGVLEVVTANPGVRSAVPAWCTRRGVVLEATADRNGSTSFRIRIGSPSLPEVL